MRRALVGRPEEPSSVGASGDGAGLVGLELCCVAIQYHPSLPDSNPAGALEHQDQMLSRRREQDGLVVRTIVSILKVKMPMFPSFRSDPSFELPRHGSHPPLTPCPHLFSPAVGKLILLNSYVVYSAF